MNFEHQVFKCTEKKSFLCHLEIILFYGSTSPLFLNLKQNTKSNSWQVNASAIRKWKSQPNCLVPQTISLFLMMSHRSYCEQFSLELFSLVLILAALFHLLQVSGIFAARDTRKHRTISVWRCRNKLSDIWPLSLLRASVLQTSTLRAASCFSLNSSSATARLYLDNCSMREWGWKRNRAQINRDDKSCSTSISDTFQNNM